MAVVRSTTADITISSLDVEQDVTTVTDDGVFELHLDVNALAMGETLTINVYGKTRSGGTERLEESWTIKHTQTKKKWRSLPMSNVDHQRWTLTQSGGTQRTFPSSVWQLDA